MTIDANSIHLTLHPLSLSTESVAYVGFSCCINDETNEDATHSFSDSSRRQLQSSDSTTQSVYSTDDVQVDDSDQLDVAWDHTYCSTGCGNIDDVNVDTSNNSGVVGDCDDFAGRFAQKHGIATYTFHHDDEQTFCCEVCSKQYRHLNQLKSHMRS